MNNEKLLNESSGLEIYRKEMLEILKYSFPNMPEFELIEGINYSINKRFKNTNVIVDNNYTKQKEETTLLKVLNYIIEREPIITVSGVMFKKHGSCKNPFVDLIQEFLNSRAKYKKIMFKYPKGSEDFEKYNILQLAEKVSGNAIYGSSGNHTSIFYNLYIARSITMQGRNCISAAILLFEATLANNVKFGSLDEVLLFINNITKEKRMYYDYQIIDEDITVEECFVKILSSIGFYYIPTDKDMMIIWDILNQLTQQELNRVFYKNNLFTFMENKIPMKMLVKILSTLDEPFIDPNDPPKIIKDILDEFYLLIKEWVYYDKQYNDRTDRSENMIRCVSVLTDTDSCFISFDGWYRFILDKTFDIPMKIKEIETDINTGKVSNTDVFRYDYDFYTDEIIELESTIKPDTAGPAVGYRCSIINILANIMGRLSIDYMNKYSRNSNSTIKADGTERVSYFILKNEFQLKRALVLPNEKKNYCSYQERQEANIIPENKALSITGMPITKVGIPEDTKERLRQILLNCVLNTNEINQVQIIKQMAVLEKQIFNSIASGEKKYFRVLRIKSKDAYDNPLSICGIKASVAYNYLRDKNLPPIDLEKRNSILIMKTDINKTNVELFKDDYPYQYEQAKLLLQNKNFASGITKIALPENEEVPNWVKQFINYTEIINDNVKTFPFEALGINRNDNDSVNYTNIISI